MHRFFIDENQMEGEKIRIIGNDVKHISQVLHMKIGEELVISDRQGIDHYCIIDLIDEAYILCKIISSVESEQELGTKLYLFQGIPKLDKMELVIQKSIELGVSEIIPVKMTRSIVKVNEHNINKKRERWQKIAEAAAKQSQRAIIPKVLEPMSMDEAIRYASRFDKIVVPYEKAENTDESSKVLLNPKDYSSIGIFIGPEGGFEEQEIKKLSLSNAEIISLGKRILRTETASVVVLSILMYNLEVE